ncbi:MAG: MBL fold metallo-hydrolase [Sulfuritalea sp.]|nr:MBL fold metallo-hydrolase [Sulfuritalea sp.]
MLFGPGVGEAIAVHLGEGQWLLVDSCEEKRGMGPVTGHYLDALGVNPGQVLAILSTHWHNDHICGLSNLANKYPEASLFISGALRSEEAMNVLLAYNGRTAARQAKGTSEIYGFLTSRKKPHRVKIAAAQVSLIDKVLNGCNVKVYALSPLQEAYHKAIAHMAQFMAVDGEPINNAPPEPSPNATAVVLHIDVGADAILLGADLEDNKAWGWSAMVEDPWVLARPQASAYKVAHHGSHTGEANCVWDTFLHMEPVVMLTPFNWGCHRLPTEDDRARIKAKAGAAFISSDASRSPDIPSGQLKRMRSICSDIKKVDGALGAVRMRKTPQAKKWAVELFGAARHL